MIPFRARLNSLGAALLGGRQGTPGALDVEGQPTLSLVFDSEEPLPRLLGDPPHEVAGAQELLSPWACVEVPTHVVLNTLGGARLAPVLAAMLRGARTFHVVVAPGASLTTNGQGALALTLTRAFQRRLSGLPGLVSACEQLTGVRLDWPRPSLRCSLELARALAARPVGVGPSAPTRIVHVIGRLGPGGAERQMVQAASAARQAGHLVEVISLTPLVEEDALHVPALRAAGIEPRALAPLAPWRRSPAWLRDDPLRWLGERHAAREMLLPLTELLRELRPSVVHGWLDEPGLLGALAGLFADVPRLVVGARNLNPSRIPRFDRPWFQGTWAALASSPRVVLCANSRAVARDYAAWAGVPPASFRVIPNGLDLARFDPLRSLEDRARERDRMGLPGGAFLVGGVFRLATMKRPADWLATLAAAAIEIPQLFAVHVGSGPLLAESMAQARLLGLSERVRFLGHRERPEEILRVCDVSLLTSEAEGLPNVALESQALEVPCVLTTDGGSAEAIVPGKTGFLAPVGDLTSLTAALVALARDPTLRAAMGRAGREHVAATFSLIGTARQTLQLYGGEAT